MYEESGLLFPYLQSFPFSSRILTPIARSNPVQASVSEYDLGGEGDLFKAPKPIMEDQLGLDPITLVSMIYHDEGATTECTNVSSISSIQNNHLLNETTTHPKCDNGEHANLRKALEPVKEEPIPDGYKYDPIDSVISAHNNHFFSEAYYDCKALEENLTRDEKFLKFLDDEYPFTGKDENLTTENDDLIAGNSVQRSLSSASLSSMEWINGRTMTTNFMESQAMDFTYIIGMRRAYSEGNIQTLGFGNTMVHPPIDQTLNGSICTSEDRKLRLSRYRIKKSKRNFGRKIKYECRKALAEKQPRVRGRFAKI